MGEEGGGGGGGGGGMGEGLERGRRVARSAEHAARGRARRVCCSARGKPRPRLPHLSAEPRRGVQLDGEPRQRPRQRWRRREFCARLLRRQDREAPCDLLRRKAGLWGGVGWGGSGRHSAGRRGEGWGGAWRGRAGRVWGRAGRGVVGAGGRVAVTGGRGAGRGPAGLAGGACLDLCSAWAANPPPRAPVLPPPPKPCPLACSMSRSASCSCCASISCSEWYSSTSAGMSAAGGSPACVAPSTATCHLNRRGRWGSRTTEGTPPLGGRWGRDRAAASSAAAAAARLGTSESGALVVLAGCEPGTG
jgi:hypothetical protein